LHGQSKRLVAINDEVALLSRAPIAKTSRTASKEAEYLEGEVVHEHYRFLRKSGLLTAVERSLVAMGSTANLPY
jgi:hypothetical protein